MFRATAATMPTDGRGISPRRPHTGSRHQTIHGTLKPITLYTTAWCGYCVAAKNFLGNHGLDFREIRVDLDPGERQRMREISKRTTVPQIFVGDHHVGGYVDMVALRRDGRFLPLLESEER